MAKGIDKKGSKIFGGGGGGEERLADQKEGARRPGRRTQRLGSQLSTTARVSKTIALNVRDGGAALDPQH